MDKNFYSPTMLVNYINLKHFITDEFGDEILNLKNSEFSEPETGSIVVMDVNTGEVICCVSSPNFNPNIFTRGIKSKEWKSLINNKKAPLLNRAVSGLPPPWVPPCLSVHGSVVAQALFSCGLSMIP